MASAALIAVLVVLIVLALASIEVTMYITHRRRRQNRRQGVSHKKSLPWSTLGIASSIPPQVLDIVNAPRPPSPSHIIPRSDPEACQVLDRPVTSSGITALNPYTPPPPPPVIPRLPLPAPLVIPWPNEKERIDTVSLTSTTRPPSYSQVDVSPLSPRYTLVMRGQWPSPVSPRPPSLAPPRPGMRVNSIPSPSISIAQRFSSALPTASVVPGAATSV
ncbi:unnamed protein product [Peniophora sp. CBMAI 1063]|nr:unnamed protein product [Peniophora sp. CBMAI 1063]